MMPIDFLLHLSAGHERVAHVHDDAGVDAVSRLLRSASGIDLISGSVLASDILSYHDGHAANGHSLSIEQMISVAIVVHGTVLRLCLGLRSTTQNGIVLQMNWHLGQSETCVLVEWEAFMRYLLLRSVRLKLL